MKCLIFATLVLTVLSLSAKADRLGDIEDQNQETQDMLHDQNEQRRLDATGAEIDRMLDDQRRLLDGTLAAPTYAQPVAPRAPAQALHQYQRLNWSDPNSPYVLINPPWPAARCVAPICIYR